MIPPLVSVAIRLLHIAVCLWSKNCSLACTKSDLQAGTPFVGVAPPLGKRCGCVCEVMMGNYVE